MAGIHWNQTNLPNPETTTGAQQKADQALAAAKAYTDANKVTSLPWSSITNKPSTFPPSSHTHSWSDITGAPATATRWPTWNEVTGKPSTFPPAAHTHSEYYTKQEVDAKLASIGGSQVAIITGTIANGGTLPLPSGYTQNQCYWLLSISDAFGGYYSSGTDNYYHRIYRFGWSVDNNRKVTLTIGPNYSSEGSRISAHYIVIGVK